MTPPIDAKLAAHQLAGLASLEAAIVSPPGHSSIRTPRSTRSSARGESPEVVTARDLVDQCDYFLAALDAHWQVIAAYLPDGHPDKSKYDDISF